MDNMENSIVKGEMIKQPLFDWIIQERDKRHWNDAELSTKAEISQSNLSQIMSGQRNVTFDFCVAIARAFRIRPEKVLYRAGLLTPPAVSQKDLTDDEAELILNYRNLPEEHQTALRNVANGLVGRFGRKE